mgnify:CR=1 FL=1
MLAVGKEPALFQQVIHRASQIAHGINPNYLKREVDLSDEEATSVTVAEALAPSLFDDFTLLIVDSIDHADEQSAELILAAATDVPSHLVLVLHHPGGVKGKRLLDGLRKLGIPEADCSELKGEKLDAALIAEFNRHKRRTTVEALEALRESIGTDLSELISAISQLCVDIETDPIDAAAVAQYYSGMSDIKGWDVSDAMWNAKPVEVLEQFRWAIEQDANASPAIIAAMSKGLRTLVKFATAPAGMSDGEIASYVGIHPFRVRFLRQQKKLWLPEDLAKAARLLALADRASKGTVYEAGTPGGVSLERTQALYEIEKNLLAVRRPRQD